MKPAFYFIALLISLLPSETNAQLAIIDSIHFRPPYLVDSIQLIRKRNDHFIDAHGNFWIGFSDLGARKRTDTLWTEFTTANSGIASNHVLDVSQAANNDMWFGTNAGVSVFNGNNWTNYNRANSGIVSDTVTVIEHSNNTHWIGTRNGLSRFDGTAFTNYTTANSGLPADSIMCLATDQSGSVWIGTRFGLAHFDGSQWTVYDSLIGNIETSVIYDIEITGAGEVWVATGKNGVYYLKNSVFKNYFSTNYPEACPIYTPSYNIFYLAKDQNDEVYFTIYNGSFTGGGTLSKVNSSDTAFSTASGAFFYNSSRILIHNNEVAMVYESVSTNHFFTVDFFYVHDLSLSFFKQTRFAQAFQQYNSGIATSSGAYGGAQIDLDVNQILARILNRGDMHWDPISQTPYYAVPVCSGKNTTYTSALWLGGIDQAGLLHTAAQTYRQQGANDFYGGPLDTVTGGKDSLNALYYDRLWKVDVWTINDFRLNFLKGNVANGSYAIPDVIAQWPAQGSNNFSRSLAPFVDYNNDGMYNALDGDYPKIDGDQMIWWIFNDQGLHTETGGTPFGFEIHGKAYGYGCPELTGFDTVFNYTTFYQWKIINRSQNTYHDMYVGLWSDIDLGNASDDYVGCDVGNATWFGYNADIDDEGGDGYGLNPPMQNITVLNGPLANPNDGIDNDHDNAIDEQGETADFAGFVHYVGSNNSPTSNPFSTDDYYEYLTSTWLDGLPITYGGDGRDFGNPPCKFMYPGTTDPAFPGQDWTMPIAGIPGDDVRAIGSSGPFTIAPGETHTIDFAYITTREPNQPISLATNQLFTSYIRNWFKNGAVHPCPHDSFTFVPPVIDTISTPLYPNPAIDYVLLNVDTSQIVLQVLVFNMQGQLCISRTGFAEKLDIRQLAGGLYLLKIVTEDLTYIQRFVKVER